MLCCNCGHDPCIGAGPGCLTWMDEAEAAAVAAHNAAIGGGAGVRDILFILGASDPEMAAIERLVRSSGARIAHATQGPARVHPGNAYRADGAAAAWPGTDMGDLGAFARVVLVECDVPGLFPSDDPRVVRVDHHRPGDPGYGRGPEEFLSASSLGQVLSLLSRGLALPEIATRGGGMADAEAPRGTIVFWGDPTGWVIHSEPGYYDCLAHRVAEDIVLAAAADHCLEAAYRGRCPGVDPDRLMRWRIESRAAHQGRPVADVMADIGRAMDALRSAPRVTLRIPAEDYTDSFEGAEVADLRGAGFVPELPEAACMLGIPFLSVGADRDGRTKVILQAAPPGTVDAFLAGAVSGLVDYYGDRARGFAGGYNIGDI